MMIRADYLCPNHGHFELEVEGGANREAADSMECPDCGEASPWSPTKMSGKVKRFEVVRGKWEKPERKGFLDTRELGEGQDLEEFRAKRRAIRDEQRLRDVKELLNG